MENSLAYARNLDAADELSNYRNRFHIPMVNGEACIYFTGNSLGLQPKAAREFVNQELDDWASLGVEGHFRATRPWFPYHEIFPKLLGKILGCKPGEVIVMNQLTVNLHLLMISFYQPTKTRYKIICEAKAFPSDQYAMQSQVRLHGFTPDEAIIEISPREGYHTIDLADILAAIHQHKDALALVMIGGVNYYTGQVFDMKTITEAAHQAGALAGFDLAHGVGNIPLKLHEWQVDFACWCSYKYLNSGPGGVGGAFIHEQHAGNKELLRLTGWWGHDKATRFQMEKAFDAMPTAEGWQLSNAPVLSMAAHHAALQIFDEAGIDQIIIKGRKLSAYLIFVLDEINKQASKKYIQVITPLAADEHGCQVSMLMLERGKEIFDALIKHGVVADWREPNVIRIAPVPLYNTFEEVWRFGDVISKLHHNE